MEDERLTGEIIGAAIEVHQQLGPGLLESTYEACLAYELNTRGLTVQRQIQVPITYKSVTLDEYYRIDMLVNNQVLIELKSVRKLEPIHEAQLLTYLKLMKVRRGLLLNFNVPALRQGIKRMLNG